jgi:hypothetical protein
VAVALAATVLGCTQTFAPINLVESLRVLAVRAEPAEVGPAQTARLDALIVDPRGGGRSLEVRWRACDPRVYLVDPAADCPEQTAWPLELAADRSAMLDVTALLDHYGLDPAALAALDPAMLGAIVGSAGASGAVLDEGRPAISLPVILTVRSADGEEEVTLKRISLGLGAAEPNQNPRLVGARYDGQEWPAKMPFEARIPADGNDVSLRGLFDPASFQVYERAAPDGTREQAAEELQFLWFATAGDVERRRQRELVDPNDLPPADRPYVGLPTSYTIAARPDPPETTFWRRTVAASLSPLTDPKGPLS